MSIAYIVTTSTHTKRHTLPPTLNSSVLSFLWAKPTVEPEIIYVVVPVVASSSVSSIALSHTVSKLVERMDSEAQTVEAARVGKATDAPTVDTELRMGLDRAMVARNMAPAVGLVALAVEHQRYHRDQCRAARLLRLLECFSWFLTPFKLFNTIFYCWSYKTMYLRTLV